MLHKLVYADRWKSLSLVGIAAVFFAHLNCLGTLSAEMLLLLLLWGRRGGVSYFKAIHLLAGQLSVDPRQLKGTGDCFMSSLLHMWYTHGGPGPDEISSPPALEYQEVNFRFLFSVHFLLCFSAFCHSLLSLSFCLAGPFTHFNQYHYQKSECNCLKTGLKVMYAKYLTNTVTPRTLVGEWRRTRTERVYVVNWMGITQGLEKKL